MDRLKLNTRKSLYPAIEVEIDEVVYKSRKLTREFLNTLDPIEKAIAKNEDNAIQKWVNLMFGIELEILAKLEFREVEDIYLDSSKKLRDVQKERMGKQMKDIKGFVEDTIDFKKVEKRIPSAKNVKRPGKKK